MSSLAFLVIEFPLLASPGENIQKYVGYDGKCSSHVLASHYVHAKAAGKSLATASLASAHSQDDLLRPVFMGCAIKNAKVVAISLGSLQRLIALKAVPQSVVPLIVSTMNDAVSQGVGIPLRILQTLVSLITNFPSIHEELLGEALLLCFKLQDCRIAVVSSTAAATLRQLVMF
ncbi:hypothetical protein EV424DRAFT_548429 [Suillus variegatus]|nr:hypothetical protein EV424DRAFT_548429 [Suillus variegatus]